MQEGHAELPVDERMKHQCRGTRRRLAQSGHIEILLPKEGLAHGDLWGATVIACTEVALEEPVRRQPSARKPVAIDWRNAGRGFR